MPDNARPLAMRSGAWALAAFLAAAAALFLAVNHPLWPTGAALALAIWMLVATRFPGVWLFVLPACLPALNLSPWTGWIGVDEFDILLLGTTAASREGL